MDLTQSLKGIPLLTGCKMDHAGHYQFGTISLSGWDLGT